MPNSDYLEETKIEDTPIEEPSESKGAPAEPEPYNFDDYIEKTDVSEFKETDDGVELVNVEWNE